MAILARTIKKELDLIDDHYILLLAAVAYNAGPGNVKRSLGIPAVAQNVGYANQLMVFQKVKF
jgi:soluble lytic murein transglycosylase-like protein